MKSILLPRRVVKFDEFLPPANEVCEGYVFTPVCQSFCSRGGGGGGRSTRAGTHPGQVPPPGQVHPRGAVHAARYEQQAGGTHPTGMHSWFFFLNCPHYPLSNERTLYCPDKSYSALSGWATKLFQILMNSPPPPSCITFF